MRLQQDPQTEQKLWDLFEKDDSLKAMVNELIIRLENCDDLREILKLEETVNSYEDRVPYSVWNGKLRSKLNDVRSRLIITTQINLLENLRDKHLDPQGDTIKALEVEVERIKESVEKLVKIRIK